MPDNADRSTADGAPPDHGGRPRMGVRAFRPEAVSRETIEAILDLARRAPSGVNTQPWSVSVLQGASRDALVDRARSAATALLSDAGLQSRFWVRFKRLPGSSDWAGPDWEHAGSHFLACADAAFRAGALRSGPALEQYFSLHGAPVALVFTIDSALGLGSVLDYGMFLQNIAAAAAVRGLHTEVQAGWKGLSDTVLSDLKAPDGTMLLAVMALGHADPLAADAGDSPLPHARIATVWHD